MPLYSMVLESLATLQISVSGRFDFTLHRDFRKAHEGSLAVRHCVVDLSQTQYIDSSALGMLLVLRDWAEKSSVRVTLRNPSPTVRKILAVANFDRLFPIE